MKLLIRRYRESPELGWGSFEVLEQDCRPVLAHLCRWDDAALLAVHNLGSEPQQVRLTLPGVDAAHRLEDLVAVGTTAIGDDGAVDLALDGYGFRWLRVVAEDSRRLL